MASKFEMDPERALTELRVLAPTTAKRITDVIRPHAPVSKDRPDGHEGGALREGLKPKVNEAPNGVELQTTSDKGYVTYVVKGTQAHIIEARTARALRFWVEGDNLVFATRVNHPGTKPNPFYHQADEEIGAIVRETARRAIATVLRP